MTEITKSFAQAVRKKADPIWQASHNHPFVTGIADGSLPLDSFKFYILQDSFYLSQFAKVKALAAAKAPDMPTANRMLSLAQSAYQAEITMHESFAVDLGISSEMKEQSRLAAPVAYSYTSHLLSVAHTGSFGEIIAALLPCHWLYYEIGEKMKGATPAEPIYQKWLSTYAGEWYGELVQELIDFLDKWAATASELDRSKMERHFLVSSQYEYMFWEMGYRKEDWPIQS